MLLAAYQMKSTVADVAVNIEKIAAAAVTAAAKGAHVLVTPELSLTGYGAGGSFPSLAFEASSETMLAVQIISENTGVALVVGFAEKSEDGIFNSAAFIRKGFDPVIYRKSHLYGAYEKSHFVASKPMTPLIEIDGIKLGMLICYDVEFPENVRRLAKAGADIIVVPTALPEGSDGTFIARSVVAVRAFENQVFIAYTNHVGSDPLFSYAGLSGIIAPDANFLDQADENEEKLLFSTINPADYAQSKINNSYLDDL
ncbi:MAG: nitrilase-related carbon-nitrogen hydrolase, partial [Sneathiella sp.]